MAEQNGGGVHKVKPKPVLPISPGSWTHHGKLQEPMELSRSVGLRRKVETHPTPFKRSSEPGTPRALEGCCPEATHRDDQYYPSRTRKDKRLPIMSTIRHSIACRRIPIRTEEAQKESSPGPKFFRRRQGRNHPTPWRRTVDHPHNRGLRCENGDGGRGQHS